MNLAVVVLEIEDSITSVEIENYVFDSSYPIIGLEIPTWNWSERQSVPLGRILQIDMSHPLQSINISFFSWATAVFCGRKITKNQNSKTKIRIYPEELIYPYGGKRRPFENYSRLYCITIPHIGAAVLMRKYYIGKVNLDFGLGYCRSRSEKTLESKA